MTKNEIINEMYNVVMNNGGVVDLCWVTIIVNNGEVFRTINGHSKNVKYEIAEQIQVYLDCLNDYVAKNAKTVEAEVDNDTEVENDTEKNAEDMTNINKDVLFNVVWGAFRFFHTQEKYVIPCDEFSTLVISMYDTICGGLDNDKTLDKFLDIVDAMIDSISESGNVRKENLYTPDEDCYDTLVLSK